MDKTENGNSRSTSVLPNAVRTKSPIQDRLNQRMIQGQVSLMDEKIKDRMIR